MNWQPIEISPKDGTKVDLWVTYRISDRPEFRDLDGRVTDAWWDGEKWLVKEEDGCREREAREVEESVPYATLHATHWMPISDPPTTE